MNFSYGNQKKIFGKDISDARYNALLETFYGYYPNLQSRVRLGKNYFEKDPDTAQLLERRILGENVYIPDEDEELLAQLKNAYQTTRYDFQSCSTQKDEKACKSLKFKGFGRCGYEKKWLSFIRGGTCIIDKKIVEHLVNNLQPFIDIRWDTLKARPLRNNDPNLPNPDGFTKEDLVNLIHDLGYHIKSFFSGKDLTTVIEEKTGKNIFDLPEQVLLYYLYLFGYVIYASQILDMNDFKQIFTAANFKELNGLINLTPAKNNLINFIVGFNSKIPRRERKSSGWSYGALVGPALILLMLAMLPTAEAAGYRRYPESWEDRQGTLYTGGTYERRAPEIGDGFENIYLKVSLNFLNRIVNIGLGMLSPMKGPGAPFGEAVRRLTEEPYV